MTNDSIRQAEQRVREMNRMAQQYSERGNSFMRQMQGNGVQNGAQNKNASNNFVPNNFAANRQNGVAQQQPRFEQVSRPVQNNGQGRSTPQQRSVSQNNMQKNDRRNVPNEKNLPKGGIKDAVFSGQPVFNIDNEKLMILLIMYILIKEKADMKLILSLGYLLL